MAAACPAAQEALDLPQVREWANPDWEGPVSTVVFHVRCQSAGPDFEELEEWDRLYLCGSDPALGAWELSRAVPMETDGERYPRWRSPPIRVPLGPVLEYKYVIMRSLRWEERKHVHWEEFIRDWGQEHKELKNRFLTTSGLPAACEVLDTRFSELEMNEDAALRVLHKPVNLFIAVHGERFQHAHPSVWREWQTKEGFTPYDDPLSRAGLEMARLTGERLRGEGVQGLYSSPHTRCVQAAAAIWAALAPSAPALRLEEGLLERVERGFPSARESAARVLHGEFPEDVPCLDHPACEIDLDYEPTVPCAWRSDDPFAEVGYWQAREHNMSTGRPPFYENIRRRRQLLAFKVLQRHQGGRSKGKGRGRGRGAEGAGAGPVPGVLLVTHRDVDKFFLEWLVPARWDWKLCRHGSLTKLSFTPGGWGLELALDRDPSHVAHLLGPIRMRPCEVAADAWKRWPHRPDRPSHVYDEGDPNDGYGATEYFTPSDQPGNQAWAEIVKY